MKKRRETSFQITTFLAFLILEAASVALIAGNGVVQRFKIIGGLREVQAFFWDKNEMLSRYFNLRSENERLALENTTLKNELSRYSTLLADSDTLAEAVDGEFSFIRARVVKVFTDRQTNTITINRGRRHGVETGMGVVTDKGIIGIVNAVGERYSQVISLLSKGQTASARIKKSGAFGPMSWTGTDRRTLLMREVSIHTDVAPGDTVVSSGFSSIYPSGIPLGTVVSSEIINGSSLEIEVRLFEDFGTLSSVYVANSSRIDEINQVQEADK